MLRAIFIFYSIMRCVLRNWLTKHRCTLLYNCNTHHACMPFARALFYLLPPPIYTYPRARARERGTGEIYEFEMFPKPFNSRTLPYRTRAINRFGALRTARRKRRIDRTRSSRWIPVRFRSLARLWETKYEHDSAIETIHKKYTMYPHMIRSNNVSTTTTTCTRKISDDSGGRGGKIGRSKKRSGAVLAPAGGGRG